MQVHEITLANSLTEAFVPKQGREYLYEGLRHGSIKSMRLWEHAGDLLCEAELTTQQIQQIFGSIEKAATDSGSNRTMLGKGKDAATAVNKAWEDLKTKVQNSRPVQNIDAYYDQAAEKLKQATGGEQGVMQYVQKYRDFAKKHPVAQSFIYSALIAAAGLSGAGLGGAAALGLFKMVDKLLQGEKFSSAAYQGAKTGGMAYAAGQVGKAMQGGDQASAASDATQQAAQGAGGLRRVGLDYWQNNPQYAKELARLNSPDIAPAWKKTFLDQLSRATLNPNDSASVSTAYRMAMKQASSLAGSPYVAKESVLLTRKQINMIVESVVVANLNEGIGDWARGKVQQAANWAQQKGANLTNKITGDKLVQAWKKAGSPMDSDQVLGVLDRAGVPREYSEKIYQSMQLPTPEADKIAAPEQKKGLVGKAVQTAKNVAADVKAGREPTLSNTKHQARVMQDHFEKIKASHPKVAAAINDGEVEAIKGWDNFTAAQQKGFMALSNFIRQSTGMPAVYRDMNAIPSAVEKGKKGKKKADAVQAAQEWPEGLPKYNENTGEKFNSPEEAKAVVQSKEYQLEKARTAVDTRSKQTQAEEPGKMPQTKKQVKQIKKLAKHDPKAAAKKLGMSVISDDPIIVKHGAKEWGIGDTGEWTNLKTGKLSDQTMSALLDKVLGSEQK